LDECVQATRYPAQPVPQERSRSRDLVRPTPSCFAHVGIECNANLGRSDRGWVDASLADRIAHRSDVPSIKTMHCCGEFTCEALKR